MRFVRGDILALPKEVTSVAPFDFMESSGVIHHLKQPSLALTKLVALLRPGAALNLALYSTIARRNTATPCRAAGMQFNVSSDISMRKFRMKLKTMGMARSTEAGAGSLYPWANDIIRSEDYASLTGIRDLCLHPQEKTFTLKGLSRLLGKVGLRWLLGW